MLDAYVVKKWKSVVGETIGSFSHGAVRAFIEGIFSTTCGIPRNIALRL